MRQSPNIRQLSRNPETDWPSFISSPYVSDHTLKQTWSTHLLQRPPVREGERLAFPHPHSFKRAALLADRIYVPCWAKAWKLEKIPIEITFGDPALDEETFDKTCIMAER